MNDLDLEMRPQERQELRYFQGEVESLPSVTVVIPVFNGKRTIRECIEAILSQDYPRPLREVIVVDNNSKDSTVQIVEEYSPVKLLHQTAVQGSYASRNLGSVDTDCEILVFTDSDCVPATDWLRHLVEPFKDPRVQAVGGVVRDCQPKNLVERFLQEENLLGKYQEAPSQFYLPLITANVAFRRTAFEALGRFNTNLYTGGDLDLAWRLQMKFGNCVQYAPAAVVYHHHRSTVKSMFRQYRRHGFGEVFLDAMYQSYPGYPRTLHYQVVCVARQLLAMLKNLRSFVTRLIQYPFRRDRFFLYQPLFWFFSEGGNVWGKLQGLWLTRGLQQNPALRQWQDPGG